VGEQMRQILAHLESPPPLEFPEPMEAEETQAPWELVLDADEAEADAEEASGSAL
jgi:hypothetical protein